MVDRRQIRSFSSRLRLGASPAALLLRGAAVVGAVLLAPAGTTPVLAASSLPLCDTSGAGATLNITRDGSAGADGANGATPRAGESGGTIACRLTSEQGGTLVPTTTAARGGAGGNATGNSGHHIPPTAGAGGSGGTIDLAVEGALSVQNFGFGVLTIGGAGGAASTRADCVMAAITSRCAMASDAPMRAQPAAWRARSAAMAAGTVLQALAQSATCGPGRASASRASQVARIASRSMRRSMRRSCASCCARPACQ